MPTEVGQILFRVGDTTYDVMVLLEGRVAILVGSAEAEREVTIHGPPRGGVRRRSRRSDHFPRLSLLQPSRRDVTTSPLPI
jgi:CRP-like cAMP-binding protein